jgi:hypothetical protein
MDVCGEKGDDEGFGGYQGQGGIHVTCEGSIFIYFLKDLELQRCLLVVNSIHNNNNNNNNNIPSGILSVCRGAFKNYFLFKLSINKLYPPAFATKGGGRGSCCHASSSFLIPLIQTTITTTVLTRSNNYYLICVRQYYCTDLVNSSFYDGATLSPQMHFYSERVASSSK